MNKKSFVILLLAAIFYAVGADAAENSLKPKKYDGIVTQINTGDGSFILRLRDGSFVTVVNPLVSNLFLSLKGVLDPKKNIVDEVTEIYVKDASSTDAIPLISRMDPGAGQWGVKISIFGGGFAKKNVISIGSYKNAIIGVPAKDGKITFSLPPKLCDKKLKTNCTAAKFLLSPGDYNIAVLNENGISNNIPFTLNPLPPLTIQNNNLPQVVGGTMYSVALTALGGLEDYAWKIASGSLPSGLNLAQASCPDMPCRAVAAIVGRPTAPGVYPFTLSLTSGTEYVFKEFSITVVRPLSTPAYSPGD